MARNPNQRGQSPKKKALTDAQGAVFVLVNLLTDLAYAKADPRVTYA